MTTQRQTQGSFSSAHQNESLKSLCSQLSKHCSDVRVWSGALWKCFQRMRMYLMVRRQKAVSPLFLNRRHSFFLWLEWKQIQILKLNFSMMNRRCRDGRCGSDHFYNMKKERFPYQLCVAWGQSPQRCKTLTSVTNFVLLTTEWHRDVIISPRYDSVESQ